MKHLMRSPLDILRGRVKGVPIKEITRRTVPCYKYVVQGETEEREELAECLLVDSGYLYRYPYEQVRRKRSLEIKAKYLKGEMERFRLREFQPGICRYIHPS